MCLIPHISKEPKDTYIPKGNNTTIPNGQDPISPIQETSSQS